MKLTVLGLIFLIISDRKTRDTSKIHLMDLNYCFLQQYLYFERSSDFHGIYLICDTLLLWKPIKPDIFMKLTV